MERKLVMVMGAVLVALLGFAAPSAPAGEPAPDDMQQQLQQALAEIQQLRAEVAELKQDGNWKYQNELRAALEEVPEPSAESEGKLLLPAGWTIKPFGYAKLDIVYDDSGGGNLCSRANQENEQGSDDGISVTARQTRLGAIIGAPNIGDCQVQGVVETDFYGSGNENGAALRMRKAYGEVKGADWMLRFGQDWEIISPLFPDTLNFDYGAFSGNPGFRYPSLRFDKYWTLAEDSKLTTQVAVTREVGGDIDLGGREDGSDASWPSVLARIAYKQSGVEFGVSGHIGEEEVDRDYAGQDANVQSWSLNSDLVVPIVPDVLTLKNELFWAENYDTHAGYFAGINRNTLDAIETFGGWATLDYRPCPEWKFTGGMGMVDPTNEDLDTVNGSGNSLITLNQYYFGNVRYFFSKYLWTGFEVSYYATDYKNSVTDQADNGDNWRFQYSWALHF